VEIGFKVKRVRLYEDNQAAITWIKGSQTMRNIHFDAKLDLLRSGHEDNIFELHDIGSNDNCADMTTQKPPRSTHIKHCQFIGLGVAEAGGVSHGSAV
jgi:hypothetical protein